MNLCCPAPPDLYPLIVEFAEQGRPFAVAVILQAEGSTPCQAGARAIIEPDGRILGTIGGGWVEAGAQQRAIVALRTGRPVVFDCDLRGSLPAGGGPICGGRVRGLIDPGAAQHLAGLTAARTVVAINNDPHAPFFAAADYGIVGDVHDVLPRLIDAVRGVLQKK